LGKGGKEMKRSGHGLITSILFVLFLAIACRTPPDVLRLEMFYKPSRTVLPPIFLTENPIYFGAFEDKRKNPDQIGQNSQNSKIVPVMVESTVVAAFVKNAFKKELKRLGFNIVDSKIDAERVLNVSIQNFWIEEKSLYEASIVAEVFALDKSGKILASRNFRGLAQKWGFSLDAREYNEVLSNAVIDLLKNILNNAVFMKELG